MFIITLFIGVGLGFIGVRVFTNLKNRNKKPNIWMDKQESDEYAAKQYEAELNKQFRNEKKGIEGEAKVRASLDTLKGVGYQYRSIHNLKLDNGKYGVAQIDHVVISETGIFVIETKNFSGSIYGDAKHRDWVQYVGSQKHNFKNPLYQNYGHIKAVEKVLDNFEDLPIHSVVVFAGDCKLKVTTEEDNVVKLAGLRNYFTRFTDMSLDSSAVYNIYSTLLEHDLAS